MVTQTPTLGEQVWCGELALTVHSLEDALPPNIEAALQQLDQVSNPHSSLSVSGG